MLGVYRTGLLTTGDLRKIGWKVVYCKHLAQDRDQTQAHGNTIMNHWVSYGVGNFLTS